MEKELIQNLFNQFLSNYDMERFTTIWDRQSKVFKEFWNEKILNKNSELSVADTDAIIKLIDTKARDHQKTDVAIAHVGQPQGVWERLFQELKEKENIRTTLNEIFLATDNAKLIDLINKLKKQNEKNKNGLTGESAVILNALLFINAPDRFITLVSLKHRSQLISAIDLGLLNQYKSYGEKIIKSNFEVINSFREKYGLEKATPRALSIFLYSPASQSSTPEYSINMPGARNLWSGEPEEIYEQQAIEEKEEVVAIQKTEFSLEKHLEDFLLRNWESTELGKRFELIEEEGDIVSPQFRTDVGNIDLLVRDKETKQFVVIELKKGQTSDDTVGQLARYMGWVKEHLKNSKDVKGVIIASAEDKRLKYAVKAIPNCELLLYKVNFYLEKAK